MMWAAAAVLFAGTVTGVQVSQPSVRVGDVVTVTVQGTNPCGAANVDYGDGAAITYAITGLPVSQSHKYERAGAFTVVARGMGNCDGEARTRVEVTDPAPPPASPPSAPPQSPAPAEVTAVAFAPAPAVVRQPVAIQISGRGSCALVVDYGDGNQQNFEGALPRRITHTYAVADVYTVIVGPVAPCVGKFTEKLEVVPAGGARLSALRIEPSPGRVREPVSFTIDGVGTCTYTVDFGDGNSEDRNKRLADHVTHVYNAPGAYEVIVRASSECRGLLRRELTIR